MERRWEGRNQVHFSPVLWAALTAITVYSPWLQLLPDCLALGHWKHHLCPAALGMEVASCCPQYRDSSLALFGFLALLLLIFAPDSLCGKCMKVILLMSKRTFLFKTILIIFYTSRYLYLSTYLSIYLSIISLCRYTSNHKPNGRTFCQDWVFCIFPIQYGSH